MRRLILSDVLSCLRSRHIRLCSRRFPVRTNRCHGRESLLHIRVSLFLLWDGGSSRLVALTLRCLAKPCRYFVATGKCQSGNKCTFIHDSRSRKATEKFSNNSTSVDARELESRKNLCQSKDFYPITWRVIGGGVMMGGERKVCDAFITGYCKDGDDCKFAHETELELDLGCLKVRSEAELPAARVFLCEANSRESNGTGEKPALNSPQGHSQLKRPCDAPTSAAKLPVPAETSQQKTPGGMPPEQMDLGTQEIGEVEITEVSTVKPLSTVPHRRTRSMVGPLSSLHAEPIVASPSFLAEF
ncbi:hypothetical protein M404DRAFT_526531 [Pisolithus tinctorius Marx 270]|uniref:C3H1-type domain-containing protein n=1 Tax=Pisolithus tinctorius Marx 270 TaxID=870435 RepID=A0A0C3J8Q1_PISTI|nr:hypothetical protein M404DRAFT_526531 [Pisolithus tinctorius Marx 270]